jgi:hypothetical protein
MLDGILLGRIALEFVRLDDCHHVLRWNANEFSNFEADLTSIEKMRIATPWSREPM